MTERQLIRNVIYETWLLLEENEIASIAIMLWEFHKFQHEDWGEVRFSLLKNCDSHKELFIMANLLSAAEKSDLSASYHLVPGLYGLHQRLKKERTNDQS